MSAGALAVARVLWPAARRMAVALGRWVLRRLRKVRGSKLATWMERRALGFQTNRRDAAYRRGDMVAYNFRRRQAQRWLRWALWLRENSRRLRGKAVDWLNRWGWEKRIPMTLPGEGRV